MSGQEPPLSDAEQAASVFAGFVCRHEEGDAVDIEAVCAEHPVLAGELRSLHEGWLAVRGQLDQVSPHARERARRGPLAEHWRELLAQLAAHPGAADHYEAGEQIGRGGFGVVRRVWDPRLKRSLAMKLLHRDETRNVARFLEEAQITAQLDHPGVVPVHELGIDSSGQLYFTMKRVRGETFDRVLQKVFQRSAGWNETRALGVLLKACEAVAFAHSRNVIHRDLKPSNLMVGRYGETYVMDWGLARIQGSTGAPGLPEAAEVRTTVRNEDSASPLLTRDGDVLGTVCYMAPEQACGVPASPASDVYSMGAILYELLTRMRPYSDRTASPQQILQRVAAAPPRPITEANPRVPAELVAIAEKAMARRVADRYATMEAMAEDLRAYLEGRVVRAHQTGAWVEFKKWVARNRGTAAALGSLVLVTAAAAVTILLQQKARNAVQAARLAESRRQADILLAPELLTRAEDLGPIHPAALPARERWLGEARGLEERAPAYREELEELRRSGRGPGEPGSDTLPLRQEHAMLQRQIEASVEAEDSANALLSDPEAPEEELDRARRQLDLVAQANEFREERVRLLEHRIQLERPWQFDAEEVQQRHDLLARFVFQLDRLFWAEDCVRDQVRRQVALAGELRSKSIDDHTAEWQDAIDSIADEELSPTYAGLAIEPQLGLVPLGPDPASGLWEFWHVLSGERPERGEDGELVIIGDTGIVLVLVPGGTALIGSQDEDPDASNYCRYLNFPLDTPVREVVLAPYFLSKYEMTQGQWLRATGVNPSKFRAGTHYGNIGIIDWTFPVEQLTWTQCARALRRWNLVLPTEAQWERGARGTGYAPVNGFGFGGAGEAEFAQFAKLRGDARWSSGLPVSADPFDTVFRFHCPVQAKRPNDFGLYGMAGNVFEWCSDCFCDHLAEAEFAPDTGEILSAPGEERTLRGGSFRVEVAQCTASYRYGLSSELSELDVGVRAAGLLEEFAVSDRGPEFSATLRSE